MNYMSPWWHGIVSKSGTVKYRGQGYQKGMKTQRVIPTKIIMTFSIVFGPTKSIPYLEK